MLLLTALDETAWLFNLRGSDISYNPVFLSYATVTEDAAKLFVDAGKVQYSALPSHDFTDRTFYDLRKMMSTDTAMPTGNSWP